MGKIMMNGIQYGVGGIERAEDISYDNTSSGMSATNVQGAVDELKSGLTDVETDLSGRRKILYMDISDSTPVNVNTQSGGVVTPSNFVSAVAQDQLVICLPYRSVNIQYIALKDLSLNAVTGSKTIRVYYVDNN